MKTAEFVSPRHPDKMCDYISDLFVRTALAQDPYSRVAVETMGGHGEINITGEVTTNADLSKLEKEIAEFSGIKKIRINLAKQSTQIAQGVDTGGAGDQGIMVGYATAETKSKMPLEYELARDLCRTIYQDYPFDGKTQVTISDDLKIINIIASFQNAPKIALKKIIANWAKNKPSKALQVDINPSGDWNIGGMEADSGVTGRKIVVDAYGPGVPVGGGAFSGKDPTKVDRSGAYMARKIAVDQVNQGANQVLVYISYGIGLTKPFHAEAIIDGVKKKLTSYDLSPQGIIDQLKLRTQNYPAISQWGHFGNGYDWDK
ncbi:MAG: methionine adenosyltransferase domain-containing protein [bacterium]